MADPIDAPDASPVRLDLDVLDGHFAVARLDPSEPIPEWAIASPLTSFTRTTAELSIVCPAKQVPADVRHVSTFRALAVRGPLDFGTVGVLLSLAHPLAGAGISIFAISTFDTDYVLVGGADLARAAGALEAAGHRFPSGVRAAIG